MVHFMDISQAHDKAKGIARAQEFDISIWSQKWNAILDNYTK